MAHAEQVLAQFEPTPVYDSYWRFAAERQAIFFRRLRREAAPHTNDPVLRRFKFTNAYRASDRVSQYLIRNVIYSGNYDARTTVFRVLLFKLFNRIETWELLQNTFGHLSPGNFDYRAAATALGDALAKGLRIYSAAYIMPPPKGAQRKHEGHLALLREMIEAPALESLLYAKSLGELFVALQRFPSVGRFLAFQYAVDLNYTPIFNFSENDFVVAGPGAIEGLRKCFRSIKGYTPEEVIRFVTQRQEAEFARLGLRFEPLCTRPLHLIDCQNLFCEIGKYARVAYPEQSRDNGRTRIKQHFRMRADTIVYWYPPKWGINACIAALQKSEEVQAS
jgi:hypothetical protein